MGNICSRDEPLRKRKDETVEVQDDVPRPERGRVAAEERVGTGEATPHRSSRISDRAAATPRSGRAGGDYGGRGGCTDCRAAEGAAKELAARKRGGGNVRRNRC